MVLLDELPSSGFWTLCYKFSSLPNVCIFSLSILIASALQVLSAYSYDQSVKDRAMELIRKMTPETQLSQEDEKDKSCQNMEEKNYDESVGMEVWNMLYNDCVSALEICIGGDLKHFHKARFMLSQGLYKRGETGDVQRAKDELSFCFKSSRSCFTINMWEIDGMVKKGRYGHNPTFHILSN